MKGAVKGLIIGAVIVAVGVAMLIAVLSFNGWTAEGIVNYDTKTYETEKEISALELELNAGQVYTEFYDGDKILIEYPVSDDFVPAISETDGVLKYDGAKLPWYKGMLWWAGNAPKTTVKIPKGLVYSLKVVLNAGTVNIGGGEYGNVDVTVNAGTVTTRILTCTGFDCKVNAGSATVNGLTCTGITNCKVNAGGINFFDLACDEIRGEVNAGSLNFNIRGDRAEYTITVDKSAGSITGASNQTGTRNDKKLDLDVSAGSIDVSFTGTPS